MARTQKLVTALLAYATYLAYKCPCDKTLGCHLSGYFWSVGTATGLVLYENYAV